MSAPPPTSSPSDPAPAPSDPAQRARQKTSVYFAITLLLLCALALVTLPLNKVPFAFRALAAAGDLVVAAFLWVALRQKLGSK